MGLIIFLILFGLCFFSVPIAASIGFSSIAGLLLSGYTLQTVVQRMFTQIDSFSMLAIPFFILSGNLMAKGGISTKLVDLSSALVGHIKGGLSLVCVVACMFFGTISGSGAAATSAIGSILIPAMHERGYDKAFTGAIAATSGPLGIIIPPSIVMVVYATTAGVSVGDMFLAGYIPGIIIGISLMLVCIGYCSRRGYSVEPKATFGQLMSALKDSIWAIIMVVIIMGGILSGKFTATEASVIAVVYAFIVGRFVYKKLELKDIPEILKDSAFTTAAVMFCVSVTNALSWVLTANHIITAITDALLALCSNKIIFFLISNVILLFLGMILDSTPAIILIVPILLPVAKILGIDPVHFGLVVTANLAIGMSTPPVGITLFVATGISQTPLSKMIGPLIPMWIAMFAFLMIITFVPQVTMFLPNLF